MILNRQGAKVAKKGVFQQQKTWRSPAYSLPGQARRLGG